MNCSSCILSVVHMADCANYSSFKTQETHLGGITKKNLCPRFCVSRDCSFIIENKCYKLSTLWSLFLVSGPSVCSDFFLLISSDWLQLGNLNPDHTVSLMLEEKMARALPLSISNFIYCLGFFFHEFQFLLPKAHIILAFKFDHCK